MKRRRLLQSAALTSISLTAGCLRVFSPDPGGNVVIRNENDSSHQITAELTDGSETVFEQQVELNPGESADYPEAFGGGSYGVTVDIDGERAGSGQLNVGRCNAITLRITVTSNTTAEIRQGNCD